MRPSQFDSFLTWINHQKETQLLDVAQLPVGYEELTGVYTRAPVASLERELLWITARIRADATRLNEFRLAATEIERLIFGSEFEQAINALEFMELAFGATLWSVQLRIAIEQHAGGLERQKRYTAEVRRVYKRGLLGFVTYHTSVRNEEKTTFPKFLDDIKLRIDRHRYYAPFVKSYVRYRLTGELPEFERALADILRVEQSHSSIDIYETFVAVVQEIARHEQQTVARTVAAECVRDLAIIADFRLSKAAFVLDGGCACGPLRSRSTELSDALFVGNVRRAAKIARRVALAPGGIDPWQYIYAGFAFAHAARPREGELRRPQDVSRLIGRIQSRSGAAIGAFAQLEKIAINLRGLPSAAGLLDMIQQFRRSRPDEPWRPWLIGMNSPTIGVEDIPPGINALCTCGLHELGNNSGPTREVWRCFFGARSGSGGLTPTVSNVFAAASLLREGNYLDAVNALSGKQAEPGSKPLLALATSLLLHAYFALGDRQKVIALIADEAAKSDANRLFLPVLPALEHYVWADYKSVPAPLAAAIALHLLWIENESDTTASLLRFATGVVLRKSGVDRPSKLCDREHRDPLHQLIYFLQEVCVPHILDVARVMKSSREVMEERQSVCAALRFLDPANAGDCEAEVVSISNQLALAEGQWIVDRTRIHVNIDALTRWATKELSEDYARYRDLLPVEVGAEQNFDEVIKEIVSSVPFQHTTFTPENEADAVLVSILRRLSEEFLTNPSFGLDFYLSKRVRHQSFIGLTAVVRVRSFNNYSGVGVRVPITATNFG